MAIVSHEQDRSSEVRPQPHALIVAERGLRGSEPVLHHTGSRRRPGKPTAAQRSPGSSQLSLASGLKPGSPCSLPCSQKFRLP